MTIALSAGGRCAATWSELKPLHEMPIMPTFPVHHGCAAIHAMTSHASRLLLREVLVLEDAVRLAGAALSTRMHA